VIFQIRVFAEPSVADVTLERPRSVVHVHVRFQIAGRRERLGAQSALVRFLLRTHKREHLLTKIVAAVNERVCALLKRSKNVELLKS